MTETVTIRAAQALLPDGWARDVAVSLEGGRVARVTQGIAQGAARGRAQGAAPADVRLDILLPAPANAHSHAFQRALAGRTEARGPQGSPARARDSFWTWRAAMFGFLDRLDPDAIEAITALAQVEMLEAGYAAVAEFHYLHHAPDGTPYADPAETSARIAAAAARTGIGLTLLPVAYRTGGCDGRALGPGQRRFGTDPDGFARLHAAAARALAALPDATLPDATLPDAALPDAALPDAALGVAAHSLRAVPAADLPGLRALAGAAPFHMHLAEQEAEVAEVAAALGARPVDWVLAHLDPDPGCSFVHCTQMTADETRALARTGAVAVLCPVTEANLGDGIFEGARWLGAGGRIALGTDSNVAISLAGEMRMLEYSQRLRDRARAVLASDTASTGRRIFDAVLAGGAQATGRAAGAIAPGRLADLVALDADHPDLAGREGDALLDAFLVAGGGSMVREVWAGGRHVVREGRHVARDAVVAAYRRVLQRLG